MAVARLGLAGYYCCPRWPEVFSCILVATLAYRGTNRQRVPDRQTGGNSQKDRTQRSCSRTHAWAVEQQKSDNSSNFVGRCSFLFPPATGASAGAAGMTTSDFATTYLVHILHLLSHAIRIKAFEALEHPGNTRADVNRNTRKRNFNWSRRGGGRGRG